MQRTELSNKYPVECKSFAAGLKDICQKVVASTLYTESLEQCKQKKVIGNFIKILDKNILLKNDINQNFIFLNPFYTKENKEQSLSIYNKPTTSHLECSALYFLCLIQHFGDYQDESAKLAEVLVFKEFTTNYKDSSSDFKENFPSPLYLAIFTGNLKLVQSLVVSGEEINCLDKENEIPLFVSLELRHNEITEFLLQKNANVSLHLKFLIKNFKFKLVFLLLKHVFKT